MLFNIFDQRYVLGNLARIGEMQETLKTHTSFIQSILCRLAQGLCRRFLASSNLKSCELDLLPPFVIVNISDYILSLSFSLWRSSSFLSDKSHRFDLQPSIRQNYCPISNMDTSLNIWMRMPKMNHLTSLVIQNQTYWEADWVSPWYIAVPQHGRPYNVDESKLPTVQKLDNIIAGKGFHPTESQFKRPHE